MKKQLGLLTLGMTMALCLAAPIVGYAAEPGNKNATVTIEDSKDTDILSLESAPNINFEKFTTGQGTTTGKANGDLKVSNNKTEREWQVIVKAEQFKNETHENELAYTNFILGKGSVTSEVAGAKLPKHNDITDWSGGEVMRGTEGVVGTFTQEFDGASIDIPGVQAAGNYVAPVTWTIKPIEQ